MTLMVRLEARGECCRPGPRSCSTDAIFSKLQEHVRSSGGINNGVSRSLNAQREHVPSVAVTFPEFEALGDPASPMRAERTTHTFPDHSSDQADGETRLLKERGAGFFCRESHSESTKLPPRTRRPCSLSARRWPQLSSAFERAPFLCTRRRRCRELNRRPYRLESVRQSTLRRNARRRAMCPRQRRGAREMSLGFNSS